LRPIDDPTQRRPAGHTQALETCKLWLDGNAGGACFVQDALAPERDRLSSLLRGRIALDVWKELPGDRGVGIKANADLARALFYERCEPIREGGTRACVSCP